MHWHGLKCYKIQLSTIYLEAVREKPLRAAGSDASLFSSRQSKAAVAVLIQQNIDLFHLLSFCLILHQIKHFRKDRERSLVT